MGAQRERERERERETLGQRAGDVTQSASNEQGAASFEQQSEGKHGAMNVNGL